MGAGGEIVRGLSGPLSPIHQRRRSGSTAGLRPCRGPLFAGRFRRCDSLLCCISASIHPGAPRRPGCGAGGVRAPSNRRFCRRRSNPGRSWFRLCPRPRSGFAPGRPFSWVDGSGPGLAGGVRTGQGGSGTGGSQGVGSAAFRRIFPLTDPGPGPGKGGGSHRRGRRTGGSGPGGTGTRHCLPATVVHCLFGRPAGSPRQARCRSRMVSAESGGRCPARVPATGNVGTGPPTTHRRGPPGRPPATGGVSGSPGFGSRGAADAPAAGTNPFPAIRGCAGTGQPCRILRPPESGRFPIPANSHQFSEARNRRAGRFGARLVPMGGGDRPERDKPARRSGNQFSQCHPTSSRGGGSPPRPF